MSMAMRLAFTAGMPLMASVSDYWHGRRRGMGKEPEAADWEQIVGRDLIPLLLPEGQQRHAVYRPADVTWLPDGALRALVGAVGQVGLEDLLVVPAVAWPVGWWRRSSCLYSPRCVVAIGERGVALWAQALPVPGIRAQVPFGEMAAVEQFGDGPRRVLVVTGRAATRLLVRYDPDGCGAVAAWTLRLRLRAGQPMP